jgi:hypothetical protein
VAVAVNIPDVGFQVFRPVIVKGRLLWHSRGISWCGKVRFPAGKMVMAEMMGCITNCTKQKGNPLHLSAMAAGVELPALLQLI